MKANSRRRVLISSMCMLIVAVVALGTATYAWFTSSTEAYADGMYVRTTKVSELQINNKLDTEWRTHVDYTVGTSADPALIMPASTVNGKDWFYASADKNTSFAATTATKYTGTLGADANYCDYYFADELNIYNAGSATCEDVTITISGLQGEYARVAIVPVTEKGGSVILEDGKTFKDYVIDTQNEIYNGVKATTLLDAQGAVVADSVEEIKAKAITEISVGDIDSKDVRYFNVYVWFEGQDVDCLNVNSGHRIPNLKFTVNGSTAE